MITFTERKWNVWDGHVTFETALLLNPKYRTMTAADIISYGCIHKIWNERHSEDENGYVYTYNDKFFKESLLKILSCTEKELEKRLETLERYELIKRADPDRIYLLTVDYWSE